MYTPQLSYTVNVFTLNIRIESHKQISIYHGGESNTPQISGFIHNMPSFMSLCVQSPIQCYLLLFVDSALHHVQRINKTAVSELLMALGFIIKRAAY